MGWVGVYFGRSLLAYEVHVHLRSSITRDSWHLPLVQRRQGRTYEKSSTFRGETLEQSAFWNFYSVS